MVRMHDKNVVVDDSIENARYFRSSIILKMELILKCPNSNRGCFHIIGIKINCGGSFKMDFQEGTKVTTRKKKLCPTFFCNKTKWT